MLFVFVDIDLYDRFLSPELTAVASTDLGTPLELICEAGAMVGQKSILLMITVRRFEASIRQG
jgi:hypothetical protein